MKVAITGATGHLGGAIIRELVIRGIEVHALVRQKDQCPLLHPHVQYKLGSIENPATLSELVQGCDGFIHAAGLISIDGDAGGRVWDVNVKGTQHCLTAAREAGIRRFVHISTIHVFEQLPFRDQLNENRVNVGSGATAYDKSKLEGERLALSYLSPDMEVIIINPTAVIGPYDDKPSRMGQALIRMYKGYLPFAFPAGFDFVDSRDVASGIVNALMMGRAGENYILGGRWAPLKDLNAHVGTFKGQKLRTLEVPFALGYLGLPFVRGMSMLSKSPPLYTGEALRTLKEGNRMISSAKAEKELKYTSRPLFDTIRDTMQWFAENGYLD